MLDAPPSTRTVAEDRTRTHSLQKSLRSALKLTDLLQPSSTLDREEDKLVKQTKKPSPSTARRVWRVFCLLGSGRVSSSCAHSHPNLKDALRCTYEPKAYQRDPDAELRARPVKIQA